MNFRERFIQQMSNISQAYRRYPVTMLLFILLSIINSWNIVDEFNGYERLVHGFLVGILLSMVAAHVNERFIKDPMKKWGILIGSVVLSVLYYLILPKNDSAYLIYEVRTAVLVFALLIAFIWIPSIKSRSRYFYQMFLAVFKYGFTTILYGLILTLGFQAIIASIDRLLFSISFDYFTHAANLIWFIFAPSYFLSLVPTTDSYVQTSETSQADIAELLTEETEAFEVTKFFRILLNYIVIPLIGVYTLILVAYIFLNIRGEFWSDNLLEPMLISYAVIVVLVYLLASNLTEPIANYFRQIFPKILILIVLFQTVASVLKIQRLGITHGRYYVILFGVFSIIAGIIFSFLHKEKSGLIAPVLVVLAVGSVIPPIDAFTVAKNSQKTILTDTLTENKMLDQNTIIKNANISVEDKEKITQSASYLANFEYEDEINFFAADFDIYDDFEDVFGFPMTFEERGSQEEFTQFASLRGQSEQVMSIKDEDYLLEMYLSKYDEVPTATTVEINNNYTIRAENSGPYFIIYIDDQAGDEVLQVDLETLFTQAFAASSGNEQGINEEDMTLIAENDEIRLRIVARELVNIENEDIVEASLYIFIDVKNE